MPLDFMNVAPQNIVHENNLRLPDALTINYGPARLLSRFVLAGDRHARQTGVQLRLRLDFDELLYLNQEHVARGWWVPLAGAFNPNSADLNPGNAFWISAEDETGEVVATWAARIYDWTGTNLAEQIRAAWYGRDLDQPYELTAEAAKRITGTVLCGGAAWVRPDFRGKHLSHLVPRLGKAYACGGWPLDWSFCYISRRNVDKGLADSFGQKNLSFSILYPDSPWGEAVIAYTAIEDVYEDFAKFLSNDLLGQDSGPAPVGMTREHMVRKISRESVLHGNNSRS